MAKAEYLRCPRPNNPIKAAAGRPMRGSSSLSDVPASAWQAVELLTFLHHCGADRVIGVPSRRSRTGW